VVCVRPFLFSFGAHFMNKTLITTVVVGAVGVFLGQWLYAQYLKRQVTTPAA
jgi:uncharacterized membrane protein YeaQ/YmgE (transglycosylase-associated protein family)